VNIWLCKLLTLGAPAEDYSRNAPWPLI